MSRSARVITEYVCKYGDSSSFNWAHEEAYEMLSDNGVDLWTNNDSDAYGERWEINGNEALQKYINKLKKLPADKTNKYFKKDPAHHDCTNKYVLEVLTEWIEAYDKEDGVIRVEWF